MITSRNLLFITLLFFPLQLVALEFVERSRMACDPRLCQDRPAKAAEFMLASEMRQLIAYLTGYAHNDFLKFDSLIGKIDLDSRTRTNDKVTPLISLLLMKISGEVARGVVQREVFLDNEERIVFIGVDIEDSPSEEDLSAFIGSLHQRWLLSEISDASLDAVIEAFRSQEGATSTMDAFEQLVAQFLQHGGLYYY